MRITEADRAKMIELRKQGVKYRDIASIMKRPVGTVATVVSEHLAKAQVTQLTSDEATYFEGQGIETTLYRHYDKDRTLLYIGISSQAFARMYQHSKTSSWWKDIKYIELEHFDSLTEARRAEAAAIAKEGPLYNSRHKTSALWLEL